MTTPSFAVRLNGTMLQMYFAAGEFFGSDLWIDACDLSAMGADSFATLQSQITALQDRATADETAISGKSPTVHGHAISETTGLQAALDAATALAVSVGTPSRAIGTAYQPHATKPVLAIYGIKITCTASLAGGQDGKVELFSDASNPPTTLRATVQNQNSVSLAIALTAVNAQTILLIGLIQPAHYAKMVSTNTLGTPGFSIISQSEIVLG